MATPVLWPAEDPSLGSPPWGGSPLRFEGNGALSVRPPIIQCPRPHLGGPRFHVKLLRLSVFSVTVLFAGFSVMFTFLFLSALLFQVRLDRVSSPVRGAVWVPQVWVCPARPVCIWSGSPCQSQTQPPLPALHWLRPQPAARGVHFRAIEFTPSPAPLPPCLQGPKPCGAGRGPPSWRRPRGPLRRGHHTQPRPGLCSGSGM